MKTNHSEQRKPPAIPNDLIIFEHSVSQYQYAPDLDMYRIDDPRFFDITRYFDLKLFMEVYNEAFEKALQSQKRIMTIPYTPLIAKVTGVCLQKYFSDMLFLWRLVSFFHDDKTTSTIIRPDGDNALAYKNDLITDMQNYPFIQRVEIPLNYTLTTDYLSSLFTMKT